MTKQQQYTLQKVRDEITEIRGMLDSMMYGEDPIDDDDYSKLRSAYDLICQANDKL